MATFDLTVARPFVPTRERPVPQLKPRGVYLADVLDAHGNPILQAVAHAGRIVSWLPWLPDLSLEKLEAELWRYLDHVDPLGPRLLR